MNKRFKKYVIIAPEHLHKLRKEYISLSHLAPIEKEMANVLKNTKLTMTQRLAVFHQLIRRFITKKQKRIAAANSRYVNKKVSDAALQTSYSTADGESQTARPRLKVAKVTQTDPGAEMKDTGMQHYPTDDLLASPVRTQNVLGIDSDGEELDYDEAMTQFNEDIRRASITPLETAADLNRVNLKFLDDPTKDYVVLEDPETTTETTIVDKPKMLVKHQQRGVKRRATEAERLGSADFSPVKSRLRYNPPVASTSAASSTGAKKITNWRTFETLMKDVILPKK